MTGSRLLILTFVLLCAIGGEALATVEVSAEIDRSTAEVGSQVVLTVVVSGEARDVQAPVLPRIPGVDTFGGGQSQRFSFVNGQVSATHTYTYYLQPNREGSYTVPVLDVNVDGRTYQTSAVPFEVVAASSQPRQRAQTPSQSDVQVAPSGEAETFITLSADKDTVVVGEQIVLTFRFFNSSRVSAFDSPQYTPPTTEGFWREELPPTRRYAQVIRSRRYTVQEISYAIFPTRAGDLEIGEAVLHMPEDAFGSLFRNRRTQRGPRILRTGSLSVHVNPLPTPQPSDFNGTVASGLRLEAETDRRDLVQGDALTLSIRLEGDGYLPGVEPPTPGALDFAKVHEAGQSAQSHPQGGRLHGVRTMEYLVIPQEAGALELPGMRYTYFDTEKNDYVTLRTASIPLRVQPSADGEESVFAGGQKSEIELLARDILHIVPVDPDAGAWGGPLPKRLSFWIAMALPAVVWIGSGVASRRRKNLLADPRRRRARAAKANAFRILAGEGSASERVQRALDSYLADRFDRSATGLTRSETASRLIELGISDDIRADWLSLLDSCDAARYASAVTEDHSLENEAKRLIEALEEACRAS